MVRVKLMTKYPLSYCIDREKLEITADGKSGFVSVTSRADIASDKFVIESDYVNIESEVVFGKKIPTDGLVLEYPIFEGSGTTLYDTSGNNNNGTIYGAVWKKLPTGKQILSFDGIDDYGIGPYLSIFNKHPFTIVVWFRVFDTEKGDNPLIACGDSGSQDRYLHCIVRYAWLYFGFWADDLISDVSIAPYEWNMATFVWEGPKTRKRYIYLNGDEVAQDTSTGDLTVTSGSITNNGFHIGLYEGNFLFGEIGLTRIYSVALSRRKISTLFEIERELFGV